MKSVVDLRILFARFIAVLTFAAACLSPLAGEAATKIERVVSPGGIEAWLVRDNSIPVIGMEFAFRGGANADPKEKSGVGNMVAALLDEGAGDLDAKTFQQRLEGKAVELSFRSQRDHFYGALRTLREHREEAFDLLRIALSAPRFEQEAIDRIRADVLAGLRRDVTSPNDIASRRWWETAFPDHPYGRLVKGSLETVPLIIQSDLRHYVGSVFTRDRLKVAVVGDIDPATLGAMLDRVFGGLPAKGEPVQVVRMKPSVGSIPVAIEFDVPQTVLIFGKEGISRKDPDFIPAFVVNHILGGGSFSSRLYSEVREKRGMAYSVYSYLASLDSSPLFMGGTATRGDRVSEAMTLIEGEIRRLAESGPTDEELAKTKSFLKGSYALQFDTSTKIANQLLQIQIEDLGIDYINRRNSLIEAVAMNDVRRAAKRLLDGKLHWAVVGRSAAGGG